METPISLDEESFERVAETVRRVEGLPPRRQAQQRPHRGAQAAPHNWITVTSDVIVTITLTNGSTQGYPAVWSYNDSATGGFVDTAYPVWFCPANDEIPFAGTRYEVRCIGKDAAGQTMWSCEFLKGYLQHAYLATTPTDARPNWYSAYGGDAANGFGIQPRAPITVTVVSGGTLALPRSDLCFGTITILFGENSVSSTPTAVGAPGGTSAGGNTVIGFGIVVQPGDVWLLAPYRVSAPALFNDYSWVAKQLASPFTQCVGYTDDAGAAASLYFNDGIALSKATGTGCSGHPPGSGSGVGSGGGTGPTFLNLCPGVAFNTSYTLTISGGCAALNGSYTLVWDGFNWTWTGTLGGQTVTWNLHDTGGTPSPGLSLAALISGGGGFGASTAFTCPPSMSASGSFPFAAGATFCPGASIFWAVA